MTKKRLNQSIYCVPTISVEKVRAVCVGDSASRGVVVADQVLPHSRAVHSCIQSSEYSYTLQQNTFSKHGIPKHLCTYDIIQLEHKA